MKTSECIKFDEGVMGSPIGGSTKCIGYGDGISTGWGDGITQDETWV